MLSEHQDGYYQIVRPNAVTAWIAASKSEATLEYDNRSSNSIL